MSDSKRYCMGCMKPLDDQAIICPHCHYSTGINNKASYISQGTIIAGRYLIGKAVSAANDNVVYIGLDKETEQTVSVCEFYPAKIASRDNFGTVVCQNEKAALYDGCLQSFLSLWRGIRMFDDIRCLPNVTDIFEDNNTAYAVYSHKDTVALKDYFAKARKPLAATKAVSAFYPLLSALKLLHNAGIVHGNITPSTIHVGADGRLNLAGFSIPQCRSDIPELAMKPVSGFSPIELYQGGTARAQSDIYSVMAVMYYSVTGTVLTRAPERVENGKLSMPVSVAQTMPSALKEAFTRSLAVQPTDRLGRVDELMLLLKSNNAPASARATAQKARPAASAKTSPAQEETVAFTPPPTPAKPVEEPTEYAVEAEPDYDGYDEYDENEGKISRLSKFDIPLPALGALTCLAVVVICFILFVVLYATVLHSKIEVPLLDDMLAPITFLPMNKDDDDKDIPGFDNNNLPQNNIEYITVPDFTKFTKEYIESNEDFNRNFLIEFRSEASEKVEKDGIIRQSVTAGESVVSRTKIILTVSTGQPEIIVPDVYGKTYDEASKILTKAGFTVSKEVIDNPDGKPGDTVSNMSIEPGTGASKGTEITLYVYDEPEEETTEPITTEPSTQPSTEPSTEPSTQPSTEPSTQPSTEPSTQPSTEPSTEPSSEAETTEKAVE